MRDAPRACDERTTALRSGGAARRRPNDSIGIDRAGSDPTIWSSCWAAARMARRARLTKVRMGRGTHDVSGTWALAWRSRLAAATSFHSLFAR